MTLKVEITKAKIDKWSYIKLKTSATKEAINRVKRQPMKCKETLINHISDKGLIFKIFKELNSTAKMN